MVGDGIFSRGMKKVENGGRKSNFRVSESLKFSYCFLRF